ncbi:hypothetical protein [Kutzneria sp. 744]|uniref:hypothetical protein n=1 Tax=Kutzneria sp. (strain 744) TaxID=345341 RepID=UPI0005BA7F2C|nr:hypothetical protein [Kutzneria sp. 744]
MNPAAMFNRMSRLNHRAATTRDPARLDALCRVFLDHGTWHVPTLAVLHAKATASTPSPLVEPPTSSCCAPIPWTTSPPPGRSTPWCWAGVRYP